MDARQSGKYTAVIGLEVHAQLQTKSKIFSPEESSYGGQPNRQVSVVSLAHPGSLPKLNRQAVDFAIRIGLACGSSISRYQIFDRKNYFYPDLPKGYQLTQDRTPICVGGEVSIRMRNGEERKVKLNRIHLEEDAGKSMHLEGEKDTAVDFNRAGVPLIELVTEPVMHESEEAVALLMEIRKLVRYLEICDGNMEEGSLRCDANVSVKLQEATALGKKVEIKNMNSFRNVQRAIDYEIERQIRLLESGQPVVSETRTFNVADGMTYGMRTKEELNDYRYFPDPDLSPLVISEEWLQRVKSAMPQLPNELVAKFMTQYQLPEYDARVLTESRELATYYEGVIRHTKNYKAASNWVMGPVKSYLNEQGIEADRFVVAPDAIAAVISLIEAGTLNFGSAAQQLFPAMIAQAAVPPQELATRLNLVQDSNEDSLIPVIRQVLKEFPLKVEEYHKGKKALMSMFMGEVMKRTKGKADPKLATNLLSRMLAEANK